MKPYHSQVLLPLTIAFIFHNSASAQNDTLSPALDPTLSPTVTTLAPSSATITPTIATRSPALELSPTLVPSLSPTTTVGNATLSPTPRPSLGNATLSPSLSPSMGNSTLSPLPPPTPVESSTSPTYSPSYAPTSLSMTLAPISGDTTLSPTRRTSAPTIKSTIESSLSPNVAETIEPSLATTISPTFNDATALPTSPSTMDASFSSPPSPSNENGTSTDAPALVLSASPTTTLTTLNPAIQQPTLSPTLKATTEHPTEYPEMMRPPTPLPTHFREVHAWYNKPWWAARKNAKSGKGSSANPKYEKSATNTLVGDGWVEEGGWLMSKSSKKMIGLPYDESFQHVMTMGYGAGTTPPPKLTGKASHLIGDQKLSTLKVSILNPYADSGVGIGIKVASKAGKCSNSTASDNNSAAVSKSRKPISEMTQLSVDYSSMETQSKAAKDQIFGTPTSQVPVPKSAKGLSDGSFDALSIDFAPEFGWIKPASKSGKKSHLHQDDVFILSKSAKMLYKPGSLRPKSGKSALTSTTAQYLSISHNGGIVMTKSAKSLVSKSSKTPFNMTVTPEEAGLPFRAKSSKSIPILNIHNEAASNNSNNFAKQVQLEKHIILDSRSMSDSIRIKLSVTTQSVVIVALLYISH